MKILFPLSLLFLLTLAACGTPGTASQAPNIIYSPHTQPSHIITPIGQHQGVPINIAIEMLMAIGKAPPFSPGDGMLTLAQAAQVFTTIEVNQGNHSHYISYALWVELFLEIAEGTMVNLVPLAIENGQLFTNMGVFTYKNINLTGFLDTEIQALSNNGHIIALVGVTNYSPTLENATITHIDAFGATVSIAGATRNYLHQLPQWENLPHIANITISGQNIINVAGTGPVNIRVAISTQGFNGLLHQSVTFASTGEFVVNIGEEATIMDQPLVISYPITEKVTISPSAGNRLEIVELGRQYRGSFELLPLNGGFSVVNQLCIEEYLYAVVPSEMPTGHGLTAAKVQAITARSYAMRQFYANAFVAYGAHICDSIMSQVYNRVPETELSIEAVRATRGKVLMVGGEIATANYFSTSGGTTANAGEVWGRGGTFPGVTPSHLVATMQFDTTLHDPGDLTQEHHAAAFFTSLDIPGYDRAFPWFRWNVRIARADLARSVATHLADIGEIIDIAVTRRGQGGNIMHMYFTGTTGTTYVETEFNVRTVFAPHNAVVHRHDGSQIAGLNFLPSGFFTFIMEDEYVAIYGGGNGHGVGMSQNGVRTLADMGLGFEEILKHYYTGVDVVQVGW